jgi:hypothetical protein
METKSKFLLLELFLKKQIEKKPKTMFFKEKRGAGRKIKN